MLALIVAVAIGTILESRHNAEYAKIALYNAPWFNALLFLMGLNVFCAMMSRYPWKIHQTGFVTTHIGIIVLLIGSWVTKIYGIDGSLQVQEGQAQNRVILPRLMLGYQFEGSPTLTSVIFSKSLSKKQEDDLDFINDEIGHIIRAKNFVPFAEVEKGYSSSGDISGPVGISFGLKSAFFDVKEWLHSEDNPEYQMGPATLRIIIDDEQSSASPEIKKITRTVAAEEKAPHLVVLDSKTDVELMQIKIEKLKEKAITVKGARIELVKRYSRALVSDNKIVESEDPTSPPNPALELKIERSGKSYREILYAKYPGFSVNQDADLGLKFRYEASMAPSTAVETRGQDLPAGHPPVSDASSEQQAPAIVPGQNVIEFHVNRNLKEQVRVVLLKAGVKVAEKIMKEGDIFQTPWMGMELFLASISFGSQQNVDVRSIKPPPGKNLPPSAIQLQVAGSNQTFWLTQGEVKKVSVANRAAFVIFSNESITLPFELHLDEFHKKDYPGTETPYSYESLVTNSRDQKKTLISMNEPLKAEGFTFYQASFSLVPGEKPVSVLSVNQDPGRWIKYLGSLILSIGIIIFTLMKSRVYKNWHSRRNT